MIGILFITAFFAFLYALVWISGYIADRLSVHGGWKTLLRTAIVIGAFPLILIDEIVGKYQFESLCKNNGIDSANVSAAKGMRVKIKPEERYDLPGKMIPIKEQKNHIYTEDDHLLFHFNDYYTKGGWLVRYTPITLGNYRPILFSGNGCGLKKENAIFFQNNITKIN